MTAPHRGLYTRRAAADHERTLIMNGNTINKFTPPLGHDDFYNQIHPDLQDLQGVTEDDTAWLRTEVPQIRAIAELVSDDSSFSKGADVIANVMVEFAIDGEQFQPTQDKELKDWLAGLLRREVPDITDDAINEILGAINDFPPIETATERSSKFGASV